MNTFIKPTKKDFAKYYQTHSGIETANYFNIAKSTVCKYAREYSLPRRSFKHKELLNILTDHQIEVINGSMLGDGCFEKPTTEKSNSRFVEKHGLQQYGYVCWKQKQLLPYSRDVYQTPEYCRFKTINHPIFTTLEKKWYSYYNGERIKRVPDDLELSPLSLAIWYFDDGYNNYKDKNIWLYTNGFIRGDVEKLIEKLQSFGVSKGVRIINSGAKRGNLPQIYIGTKSYFCFLEIVAQHVVCDCIKYKTITKG